MQQSESTGHPIVRVGLIGTGISASLTPSMHMREGTAQGLDYRYDLIDLNESAGGAGALGDRISEAQGQGFDGLNITHPCKQAVLALLDDCDDEVIAIGACNTVVFTNGRRVGFNTDWRGFAEAFHQNHPAANLTHVLQLGAGGAGAAVAYALLTMGVERLDIHDPDPAKVNDLASRYGSRFGRDRVRACADLEDSLKEARGVVQTSPVGSLAYPGLPVDLTWLNACQWLTDIIYFPLETELVKKARGLGIPASGGGGMAVLQAVHAFEKFTGLAADRSRVAAHFAELTKEAKGR